MPVKSSDVLLIIVAIIFPPAASAFVAGCCSCDLLINILLTILGFVPGLLHALWLIYRKMEAEERYGHGGFHYVGNGQFQPLYAGLPPPVPSNYGATTS